MTDYNGHTTSYTYTARRELATITTAGSRVWTFSYNALGQRTQYTHPNGTRTEYVYDTENWLTGILHKDASTNAVLDSFTYTLNDGGGITQIYHADNSYWSYAYDNRDRLTGAVRRNAQGSMLHWFNYTYNAVDSITQRWRFQSSGSQMDTWNFAYNAANQQVSMTLNGGTPETRTYDDLGRLAARAQGSYSASYSYRYGGRWYQATSNFPGETNVTLNHGGDGKLRIRVTPSRYRYGYGFNALNEEGTALGAIRGYSSGGLSGGGCGFLGGLVSVSMAAIGATGGPLSMLALGALGGFFGGMAECLCNHSFDTSKAKCCLASQFGGAIGGVAGSGAGAVFGGDKSASLATIGAVFGFSAGGFLNGMDPGNECCEI